MDELLRYFEEELALFGAYAREFRARYPKAAGALHITGETFEDPSVARLIQSVALMSARIRKRLDDDYPRFTESLLDSLYPHLLRPLPSYSIAQVGQGGSPESEVVTLPRGTVLRSAPVEQATCQFRTAYDVVLSPLVLASATFAAIAPAPRPSRMPRGVTACISLTVQSTVQGIDLAASGLKTLRLFVDGEPSLRAALLDALFLRTAAAYVQAGDGDWRPLRQTPLRLAGFGEQDGLLPFPSRAHPAFRLLTEFFTYPEKFNFIDLDIDALLPWVAPRCQQFTVHLLLSGIAADADEARLLSSLSTKNLLAGCTPVLNLFDKPGVPVQLSHTSADCALVADVAHASAYEIYSVDEVHLVRETAGGGQVVEFSPLYAVRQDRQHDAARDYWLIRRDETVAATSPGHEVRISLLDASFKPSSAAGATLSTELTCTNRDLPARLRYGLAEGDLHADGVAASHPIRLLRKPTPSYRFEAGNGAHWRLISHLALNYARLTEAGLGDFQKMLALYDVVRSPASQRMIGGIVGLEHGLERAWVKTLPASTLMPGIGIRLTLDEEAFAGTSIALFAQVLERYFAMNAQLNCYTRLTLVSEQTGQEIIRCQPRTAETTRA
jgi:type VI secretion system protein ImpG